MDPVRGTREPAPLNLSLLGSGERSLQLAKWLEFLARDRSETPVRVLIREMDDLLDGTVEGIVLVDADRLDAHDSGLLRRRVQRDGLQLWLFGDDPARAVVARLFRQAGARWLSWAPDLDSLQSVLDSGQAQAPIRADDSENEGPSIQELEQRAAEIARARGLETEPQFELRPTRPQTDKVGLEPGELEQIEAILRGQDIAPSEEDPDFDDLLTEFEEEEFEEEAETEAPRLAENPSWFKDQVADLADHVQRIELGLAQVSEEGVPVEGPFGEGSAIDSKRLRDLSDEAARLGQFTRTLGFLAAPPARGGQLFDLRTLLEEQLRASAAEPEAPRFLIRIPEVLPIRSDKTLLLQAFDALIFMARSCTPAGDTLRVEASSTTSSGVPMIEVSIRFPRGPLAGLETSTMQRPYGLRRMLPQLGPNAIAAARGIFHGQGGDAFLVEDGPVGLEWHIVLPRVDPAAE